MQCVADLSLHGASTHKHILFQHSHHKTFAHRGRLFHAGSSHISNCDQMLIFISTPLAQAMNFKQSNWRLHYFFWFRMLYFLSFPLLTKLSRSILLRGSTTVVDPLITTLWCLTRGTDTQQWYERQWFAKPIYITDNKVHTMPVFIYQFINTYKHTFFFWKLHHWHLARLARQDGWVNSSLRSLPHLHAWTMSRHTRVVPKPSWKAGLGHSSRLPRHAALEMRSSTWTIWYTVINSN